MTKLLNKSKRVKYTTRKHLSESLQKHLPPTGGWILPQYLAMCAL